MDFNDFLLILERTLVDPAVVQSYEREFQRQLDGLIQRTTDPALHNTFASMKSFSFANYIAGSLFRHGCTYRCDPEDALQFIATNMLSPLLDHGEAPGFVVRRNTNDVETNGVLLDEAWCKFFREHGFMVGLSIDGPKRLHDRFRVTQGGTASFDQVYRAAQLLREHQITFNTLTVINAVSARQPVEVYRFLTKELGCRRLQWQACVEPKDFRTTPPGSWDTAAMPIQGSAAARPGNPDSVVTDWSVDPDDWGEFLCQTFSLWLRDGPANVLINWFTSLWGQWMGQPAQVCALAPTCGRTVAIEKDGGVYACDHYVYPEYRLGSLRDENARLGDMIYSSRQQQFGRNKRDRLPQYCRRCPYSFACNGECPRNRFIKSPDGEPGLNYLCSGIRRFLAHADPSFRRITAQAYGSGTAYTSA